METKYRKALESFIEDMIDYIDENFEGEKGISSEEASYFLGQDTSSWSQEEIDEAVEEIQKAYYTERECGFDKIVEKFLELGGK